MACDVCKSNAVVLADIRRELQIANGQLARLLTYLDVPPASVGDGGVGVLEILRKAPPGRLSTNPDS